jgi:hypothetical protein
LNLTAEERDERLRLLLLSVAMAMAMAMAEQELLRDPTPSYIRQDVSFLLFLLPGSFSRSHFPLRFASLRSYLKELPPLVFTAELP